MISKVRYYGWHGYEKYIVDDQETKILMCRESYFELIKRLIKREKPHYVELSAGKDKV